jgi:hypothetical protein
VQLLNCKTAVEVALACGEAEQLGKSLGSLVVPSSQQPSVSMSTEGYDPGTVPKIGERIGPRRDAGRLIFDSDKVLERVGEQGDLFASLLTLDQRLPSLRSIG